MSSFFARAMSLIEGISLLRYRAQGALQLSDDELKAAGDLVVALDQTGAYIEETGCTFDHYLQLFHTRAAPC
jgi:hypothetical protein